MKRIALASTVTFACLAATASLSAHAASTSSPPCTPKITKIQGHQAAVNCGPATATLHIAGRTYTFRNGFCQQSKAAGPGLELTLGTIVLGAKGNAGRPDFSMTIVARLHSAFGSGSVNADYGGKDLLAGEGLIKPSGHGLSKGTFTSTLAVKFTGSWNCHGVVFQGP